MLPHNTHDVLAGMRFSSQDPKTVIGLLETELSTTNHEVMILTLELEQRVAERTAQLSQINQELMNEIVERRRAEEEVRRLNRDLQHRAALLQEANEELDAFSSSISHDLRSPLCHIVGFVSILEDEAGTVLDDRARQHLIKVKAAAKGMSCLIDELLRFSRFSHAELHLESADLNLMVDGVIADFEPDVSHRNVAWKRTQLPSVPCDATLLQQVLANLISNALKYTRGRDLTERISGIIDLARNSRQNPLVKELRGQNLENKGVTRAAVGAACTASA